MLSDRESGIVLECGRTNDTSLVANLNVTLSVPDTKGMHLEQAQDELKKLGFEAVIEWAPSFDDPNVVQRWVSVDDNTVKLWVTQPMEIKPRSANIKWKDLPESAGDRYSVEAVYKTRTKNLKIEISFVNGSKTKYKIAGVAHDKEQTHNKIYLHEPVAMDPGNRNTLTIGMQPRNYRDEGKLLDNILITLEAQYGIVKKTVQIPLEITFEW